MRYFSFCLQHNIKKRSLYEETCPPPYVIEVTEQCNDSCFDDDYCVGKQMCCFDGCSYVCMDPIPSEAGNHEDVTILSIVIGWTHDMGWNRLHSFRIQNYRDNEMHFCLFMRGSEFQRLIWPLTGPLHGVNKAFHSYHYRCRRWLSRSVLERAVQLHCLPVCISSTRL